MSVVAPIVVVHAPYHQPAHYEVLAEVLRGRGHAVVLPDVGGRDLPAATRIVQQVVDRLSASPVVVAHSFSGAIVGALTGVARMVFISAFVLLREETALSVLAGATGGEAFMAALREEADGTHFSIDPAHAGDLFYGDCAPGLRSRAVELLRPDLAVNFGTAPVAVHWRDTPSLYVRTTRDPTWPLGLSERFAARCERTVQMSTSHSPFLSRPEELADLISIR